MSTKLLLLVISVTAFSSCSTLYRSGQTPDDVYFSPTRETYVVQTDERRDEPSTRYYSSGYDRTIRLGINDRRWRYFDNDYAYNPYMFGFNYGYYYNPYFWPSPVYSNLYGPVYVQPRNPKITTPRVANLGGYSNNYYNSNLSNTKSGIVRPPVRSYNNNNRGSSVGNAIRQIFTPSNTPAYNPGSNNTPSNNNSRTYQPSNNSNSSSSGSSSSSSGSGGGGVTRPPRGGGN